MTSPPYLNAIDYMRTSKFSLVFLGSRLNELRAIRSAAIGTLPPPRRSKLADSINRRMTCEFYVVLIKETG